MHFYSTLIQLMMINLYIILNVFQNSHCYLLVFSIYGDITIKFSIYSTLAFAGFSTEKEKKNHKKPHACNLITTIL